MRIIALAIFSLFLLTSCRSAVQKAGRNVAYSAYEMIGVEKRDLLKDRVEEAREEQKEAQQTFEDALTRMRKMYGLKGGKLESQYSKLQSSYEDSAKQAQDVETSIGKMETIAGDLFVEWKKEIKEIQTPEYRKRSQAKLKETQVRFTQMSEKLKTAEERMQPVLVKFKDHVLYLKHNLNAQTVAQLKGESGRIENEIEKLIDEMNQSINEADRFIKTIE
jgi:hypothetical protein